MATTAGDVCDQARTLLNDDTKQVWTDAALLPKLAIAHRELQTKLWIVGSPAVRKHSAGITVIAAAKDLGVNQPTDLITPIRLKEYASAGSAADAVDMTEVTEFEDPVAATLDFWNWQEDKIQFAGASADRKVIIYYRRLITIPTVAASEIGVSFGELFLAPRLAAIAHGSLGNIEAFQAMTEMAKEGFDLVLQAHRGQQNPTGRP